MPLFRTVDVGGPVVIDLSDCRHFDVVTLLQMLAVTAARSERDRVTRFRLPHDPGARELLRRKSFPSAVKHVTQVPFRFLVAEQDARYFGEASDPTDASEPDPTAAIFAYLSRQRFFSFRAYRLGSRQDRSALIGGEWEHWRNPLIMQALERQLAPRDPRDFTRVVVQELLASLLRHDPRGTVITASQIQTIDDARYLTVAAWLGETQPPVNICERILRYVNAQTIAEDEDRNAVEAGQPPAHVGPSRQADTGQPFMTTTDVFDRGIQALCQTVTQVFAGRLEVWSARTFVHVALDQGVDSKFTVRVDPELAHELPGNLVAARIPLES